MGQENLKKFRLYSLAKMQENKKLILNILNEKASTAQQFKRVLLSNDWVTREIQTIIRDFLEHDKNENIT